MIWRVVNLRLDVQFRLRVRANVIMSWHNEDTRITACCSDTLGTNETPILNLGDKHGFHFQPELHIKPKVDNWMRAPPDHVVPLHFTQPLNQSASADSMNLCHRRSPA
jgi:hypothetical protein